MGVKLRKGGHDERTSNEHHFERAKPGIGPLFLASEHGCTSRDSERLTESSSPAQTTPRGPWAVRRSQVIADFFRHCHIVPDRLRAFRPQQLDSTQFREPLHSQDVPDRTFASFRAGRPWDFSDYPLDCRASRPVKSGTTESDSRPSGTQGSRVRISQPAPPGLNAAPSRDRSLRKSSQ